MQQVTHKRLYNWHSVGALILSTLLIILCLTGIPIIFKKELNQYVLRGNTGELNTTITLDQFATQAEATFDFSKGEYHLVMGDQYTPHLIWLEEGSEHVAKTLVEGKFEELIALDALDALSHMHYNFFIPDPYGEYFVGLIGLLSLGMMFLGILLHVKWKKENKKFRKTKSFRLWASDLHKLTGFWLLPFHLVVTYTGATLGLGGLLLIMSAISSFEGDQDAAVEAVLGKEPVLAETACKPLPISQMIDKANQHWADKYGDSQIETIEVHYPGDCNAEIGIASKIPGYLLLTNFVGYSLVDGSLKKEIDWASSAPGNKWYATVGPLHFGHFAGVLGKWIYVISSLLLIVLIFSGLLLWVDKKQEKPLDNKLDYLFSHPLLKGSFAVSLTTIAVSFNLLIMSKLYPEGFHLLSGQWVYLSLLALGTLLFYALPQLARLCCYFFVVQIIALLALDLVFGIGLSYLNGVNASLVVFAGCFLYFGKKLKQKESTASEQRLQQFNKAG